MFLIKLMITENIIRVWLACSSWSREHYYLKNRESFMLKHCARICFRDGYFYWRHGNHLETLRIQWACHISFPFLLPNNHEKCGMLIARWKERSITRKSWPEIVYKIKIIYCLYVELTMLTISVYFFFMYVLHLFKKRKKHVYNVFNRLKLTFTE
jgi:hypothetical protein